MEPEFYQRMGIAALGSRLRRLSEMITGDAAAVYALQGITFEPRWFPVFYMLDQLGPLHVSDLAEKIGQSHAAVSQTAKQMKKAGMVEQRKDKQDKRKQWLQLSKNGQQMAVHMTDLYEDVERAVEQLLSETTHHLWHAIRETESALEQRSLLQRVREQIKIREAKRIKILDYTPAHQASFSQLNREWIERYFRMEPADKRALNDPDNYIINRGGHILLAMHQEEVVGVVALIPMPDGQSYELAKMAVSPRAQGKGIGYLLGLACLEKANQLGTKRLYLESNTILEPAINLYRKLGFTEIPGKLPSPYARSNIQMELYL